MALARADWIAAARTVLAEKGVAGVRVEVLARTLGVSKGSFYWHFKNRQELLNALLHAWAEATDAIISKGQQCDSAAEQLHQLFHSIEAEGGTSGEDMVQAWAKQDASVAAKVQQVEQKRLAYLQEIFARAGFSPDEATQRAEISYLAFLGYAFKHANDAAFSLALSDLGQEIHNIFLGEAT